MPRKPKDNTSWPIFDSMKQAAAALGCDETQLKEVKKAGGAGFRYGRIYPKELLSWLLSAGEGDVNWSSKLKEYQAKREQIRLATDEKKIVEKPQVVQHVGRGMAILFTNLDRVFCAELPAVVVGLKEAEVKRVASEKIEGLKSNLREEWKEILA